MDFFVVPQNYIYLHKNSLKLVAMNTIQEVNSAQAYFEGMLWAAEETGRCMMKEKYYEAGEILAGLIHPKGEVTNDKLTGAAEELQRNNLHFAGNTLTPTFHWG